MKRTLIVICFLTCWIGVSAQSLREVWIEMPIVLCLISVRVSGQSWLIILI